jgi:Tfp pilus assembly protein PilX
MAMTTGPSRQDGAVGIVALMFILIIVLFAMRQAATIAASNMMDSARQSDSVEALYLAESAVERVGYQFVNSGAPPTCNDSIFNVGTDFAVGSRGVFRVLGAYNTDFSGGNLLNTMCRVRVQGEISATKVTRTVDTIVATEADLISISSLNPNFNNAPYDDTRLSDNTNAPASWNLTGGTQGMVFIGWDQNGGNSDDNITCKTSAASCNRAAFARKTDTGSGAASSGGAFNTSGTPINITAPKTLRLTFDFRVWTRGSSPQDMSFAPRLVFNTVSVAPRSTEPGGGDCSTSFNGECASAGTAAGSPAWGGAGGSVGPGGCGYMDTPCFESGPEDLTACPGYDPGSTGYKTYGGTNTGVRAGFYTQCLAKGHNPPVGSTGYRTGYLTYDVPGSGTVQLTGISFLRADGSGALQGKEGQVTWLWIDNLRLSVPSISGGGPSKIWREVAAP